MDNTLFKVYFFPNKAPRKPPTRAPINAPEPSSSLSRMTVDVVGGVVWYTTLIPPVCMGGMGGMGGIGGIGEM